VEGTNKISTMTMRGNGRQQHVCDEKTTAAADRMESFLELGDGGELVHQQLA